MCAFITSWILARPGKPLAKQYSIAQADLDKFSCVLQPTESAKKQGLICVYKHDAGAINKTTYANFPANTVILDAQTANVHFKQADEGTDTWDSIL